jgi:1,2-diacylglycerol 3-alpha-glucosyltransferase
MFTNTYLPHVGGVARSVSTYESALRERGHDVWVIAPQFEGATESTEWVLRTPAVPNFNGTDFSWTLPQPGLIADFLDRVGPEIIHSHHPFQLGDSALRAAWTRRLPVVFTHHTLYEQYTHYLPLDSEALQRITLQMVTEYANLCSHVIAPSQSLAEMLVQRCVTTPITVLPTGIDMARFGSGNGQRFRRMHNIPEGAFVVGHVGRLAGEKNLDYLAQALGQFLARQSEAMVVVVGSGEVEEQVQSTLTELGDPARVVMPGVLKGQDLIDAYAAMDLFAFSSQSETQGMVLAEAMAARTAVIALDGPGVRDVLNRANGVLLPGDAPVEAFVEALLNACTTRSSLKTLGEAARHSVQSYSLEACTDRLIALYGHLIEQHPERATSEPDPWDRFLRRLEIEWNLLAQKTAALTAAVVETEVVKGQLDRS